MHCRTRSERLTYSGQEGEVRGSKPNIAAFRFSPPAQLALSSLKPLLQRLKVVLHQLMCDFLSKHRALHNGVMEMHAAVDSSQLHLTKQVLGAAEGASCGVGASAERRRDSISDGHMQSQILRTKIVSDDRSE